ncbi:hypothetical protein [Micromonospora sp. NPDC049107]|uniref:hypothetical protein n=1 Tax=Micromonospora sp. NPDC049107 TaxID=3154349 RepID=UPI0034119502
MIDQPLSELIRALHRADWDAVDALSVEIGRHGLGNGLKVIGAAFAVAVERRFGADATPSDVAAWVSGIRSRQQGGDPLPVLEMEGLIRAVLGEPELVDSISPETALGAELFMLGQLLREADLSPAELDEFTLEAEQLAAEHL